MCVSQNRNKALPQPHENLQRCYVLSQFFSRHQDELPPSSVVRRQTNGGIRVQHAYALPPLLVEINSNAPALGLRLAHGRAIDPRLGLPCGLRATTSIRELIRSKIKWNGFHLEERSNRARRSWLTESRPKRVNWRIKNFDIVFVTPSIVYVSAHTSTTGFH